MPVGARIHGGNNAAHFNTGDWRAQKLLFNAEKCKQCLLCFPVCPDRSIPVQNGRRGSFDCDHCKGCGICAAVCPFGAITMEEAV